MKTTKIILHLTDEQKQSLIQQLTGALFAEAIEQKRDRFKYLRQKSKQFIIELEERYGNNWINRNDKFVKDLCYKHRVGDLSQLIKTIDGSIEYAAGYATEKQKIARFKTTK
mgnify:CR=1 FL=1